MTESNKKRSTYLTWEVKYNLVNDILDSDDTNHNKTKEILQMIHDEVEDRRGYNYEWISKANEDAMNEVVKDKLQTLKKQESV